MEEGEGGVEGGDVTSTLEIILIATTFNLRTLSHRAGTTPTSPNPSLPID